MTQGNDATLQPSTDEQSHDAPPDLVRVETELAESGIESEEVERKALDAALMKEVGLSLAQIIAMEALAKGTSVAEAAAMATVHAGTLYRWKREDVAFIAHFELVLHDLHEAAKSRLTAMQGLALDALEMQLRRGDGRLALDLLREMKVTAKSRETPARTDNRDAFAGESQKRLSERIGETDREGGEKAPA